MNIAVIRDADATREKNPQMSVREIVAAQLDVRLVDQPGLRTEILDRLTEVYSEEGDLAGAGSAYSRMAKAALAAQDAGRGDAAFLSAKLATGRYYMARQLPATSLHLARIRSGAAPVMALPAEVF